jgi:hypothetical protein
MTLRIADGFIGDIGDTRSLGIVLELGGRRVGGPELRRNRIIVCEHVDIGMVEPGQQQFVDGCLEGFDIVEDRNCLHHV